MNLEVECALKVILLISIAILNLSDLHDDFCEACGKAGVVEECLKLLQGLKIATHDLRDKWVSPSITDRMQMTSPRPCLCTRQNSREMVMVALYVGNIVTNSRGVLYLSQYCFG